MFERARRWGILPSYYGWQGDLVQTPPETEQAILLAMGAESDRPPSVRLPRIPNEKCPEAPARVWGGSVQLYALRSRDSWGIGDFADLRRFARWSKRAGASNILLNPLGAQAPTLPYEPSPYYASTRRFGNVLYLRIEDIEGAQQIAADLAQIRANALALNRERLIDYDEVFRLKSEALERIFRAAPNPAGLTNWARKQGRALADFATFNALCEQHGKAWRDWPGDGRAAPDRVAFHKWLQFHLDRQFARAAREIGIITDVPVGFASDVFDAWRWRAFLSPR